MANQINTILLIGPTGSGKTPFGDYLEQHGIADRACLHFDFGSSLRSAAQGILPGFTEEEIIRYCEAKNLPHFSHTCQYALDFPILRKKVQKFIRSLDERSFELKYNVIQVLIILSIDFFSIKSWISNFFKHIICKFFF